MKKFSVLFLCLTLVAFVSCKDGKKESKEADQATEQEMSEINEEAEPVTKSLTVDIAAKSGSDVTGQLVFTQEDGKVKLEGEIEGLEAGKEQAIHLHEKGDCSADDATSAGGHWNPMNEEHGKWNSQDGYHKGDIGNLEVDEDGKASITFETDQWCIDCDDDAKNIVGKAVVVHEGADDFETQPTGDAGGRVGCGVIIK